jgi:hypothetical protein
MTNPNQERGHTEGWSNGEIVRKRLIDTKELIDALGRYSSAPQALLLLYAGLFVERHRLEGGGGCE